MSKYSLIPLLLLIGCANVPAVDLHSTFIVDSAFTTDQQVDIVSALYDWEQATHGIVDMKLIITDNPDEYGPLPQVRPSHDIIHNDLGVVNGRTNITPDQTVIYIYVDVNDGNSTKNVALHEMGHAFGLHHTSTGLMTAFDHNQTCIEQGALDQFCEIHHCSGSDFTPNCAELGQ